MAYMNLNELLQKHAAQLAEHFDSVQILAETTTEGYTRGLKCGRSSWFARQGMAHSFIGEERADEIGLAVGKYTNPPEEDFSI